MLNRRTLRVALAEREQTLKDLAPEAGIDLLRLYRIASTHVRPREEELVAIAECLGLPVEALRASEEEA